MHNNFVSVCVSELKELGTSQASKYVVGVFT